MSDRELLALAAKALDDPKLFANTTGGPWQYWIGFCEEMQCDVTRLWNPLEDDGDALRLANSVRLTIYHADLAVVVKHKQYSWEWLGEMVPEDGGDRNAAARRAIVRAAAEIGKSMQEKH
ncbi:hypothetical protein [Pseudomonas mosselii]|uniref:DUF2591 domain-containing protein n=1 Tax=Pseudomonas mosselii TaxID=78327 RepID=A0A7W2K0J1_9PSED|nr:hypothetical protein [Pseudomonas mosselii]MBA6068383.1 hypothetical protein [Pseudomonas mosselii]